MVAIFVRKTPRSAWRVSGVYPQGEAQRLAKTMPSTLVKMVRM